MYDYTQPDVEPVGQSTAGLMSRSMRHKLCPCMRFCSYSRY